MIDEKKPEEIPTPEEEGFVGFGKSWEDLEKEMESAPEGDVTNGIEPPKLFFLSKAEIAEFAYDASSNFRHLVESFTSAGEEVKDFEDLSEDEKKEWTEIAGLALNMQGDPSDDNFARLVHAKTSMGLLKDGVKFDEKFSFGWGAGKDGPDAPITSPLVAPWECLPHERRIPLLIFKAVCRQLYRVWDRDNELLKR